MSILEQLSKTFTRFTLEETEQSVASRFEKLVMFHGDRLAITDANSSLSYGALNQLANRMARTLIELAPASQPARVAIYMEKGIQNVAAIFAVLKCGHAYVPIDPSFPASRNQFIFDESESTLLLTNDEYYQQALELADDTAAVINLDNISDTLDSDNLNIKISPDALAYIIYTSGSTGRPKGVVQNQRNLLHGCMRRTNLQKVTPRDRMTLFYSCSVIASVYCIFGALLNGASLFPYEFREEGIENLASWLRSRRITIYHSVASLFREFAKRYNGPDNIFDIRLVIFGGERVLTSDIALARKVFSRKIEFYTGLGSTETGTIRYFPIGPETEIEEDIVPIGYPVEGVDVVLLDENGREVPAGEIGEITVKSRYIALGYWHNEEATGKAFGVLPDNEKIRLYRTGDLGQMDEDGLLHHRGRKDFQVKIRGFRVEINEIEVQLLDHPAIAEAVVVARDINGETQLAAYLVFAPDSSLNVQQLRSYLKERLNYYMVPSVYVVLSRLPKTPNNKVDRNALPEPELANELEDTVKVAPVTPTEIAVVEFCCALLERQEIGSNQNFFDLGGHSLTAAQLAARINDRFGIAIAMRDIFEAEDLAALAQLIEQRVTTGDKTDLIALQHAPRDGKLPLSPAQMRMWLAGKLYGENTAYNISNTVYLEGPIEVAALEFALTQIQQRHESLRTVFPSDDDGPWQQVLPAADIKLEVIDLRSVPRAERAVRAMSVSRDLLREKLDVAAGPLFRSMLIRVGDKSAILGLVFHHIIYDNIWSSGLFFRELGELYQRYAQGDCQPLEALPFQFADYAYWEQQRSDGEMQRQQLDYWRDQLSHLPDPLAMPADREPPEQPSMRGGLVKFKLPIALWSRLQKVMREESVTSFMFLLAGWQLLLSRYSQQKDVLVGTPSGRRHLVQTEPMIGLFINTLVMRLDLSGEPDFRTLLQRARNMTLDAFSNDQIPFEALVSQLNPARDARQSPFFQHLFIHRKMTGDPWQIPGLKVRPLDIHAGGAKFDLTLSVLETDDELRATIEYSSDLFDRRTVARLAQNYIQLLESAVGAMDKPVSQLPLLAPEERALVCEQWNRTEQLLPAQHSVTQLFEQQVQQQPDKTALIADDATLTYGQLNLRANQLAAHLRDQGLHSGDLVAVCLHRSSNLLVTLLAILKTGATYVPLDPYFPAERLFYMLQDSAAPFLVTQPDLAARFAAQPAKKILLTEDSPIFRGSARANPHYAGKPEDLAYVIYTSGSTGKPKGVQVTQLGLVNFLCSMQKQPGMQPQDTLLSVTTVCFDIAMLELFLPLISGASVLIQGRDAALNPQRLLETMRQQGVTMMQATPATWRMLLDFGWRGDPAIKVLCGGEAMGLDLARRLLDCGLEVWNLYGPTETTIWSAVSKITRPSDAALVGEPIDNTQFFVLSQDLALLPIGVPGELCIGGTGLARGYLNRPELTEERFVEQPLAGIERLYRTGDLVRRRMDGALEFLGRMDSQIKIRGYRVELGEIEHRIAANPGVRQCAVIAFDDDYGSKQLVAFMLAEASCTIDVERLRADLRKALPDYMVPAAFVPVDSFPLTPNGKVDRKAFRDPRKQTAPAIPAEPKQEKSEQPAKTVSATAIAEAPAAMEPQPAPVAATPSVNEDAVLAEIKAVFEEVLKLPVPADGVSFFDLGGHSLSALNAIAKLNSRFSLDMPPMLLFDFPSVAALSGAVRQFMQGAPVDKVLASATLTGAENQQVDRILEAVHAVKDGVGFPQLPYGMRMRESEFARIFLAPLFKIRRNFIRNLVQKLILKLEGGSTFSVTIRKLYKKYFDIEVGDFSSVPFNPNTLKANTKIGRFSTIFRTTQFQTADHPRNTMSTHGIFYYAGFGFSSGYELDRVQVEVGNDVWIADGAKILYPTKKIGDGAVIAAGSIVIEDVPPYAIVAGYPARVVRYRFAKQTIDKLLQLKWWDIPVGKLYQVKQEFTKPLEGESVR